MEPGPAIVLATLNAKYIHAAFGLRYLLANMGELRARTTLREFDINQRPIDIAESILALHPTIVGLGVYIWNVAPTTELISILKSARPELIIVIGGPEVSFECDRQEIVRLADYVITGEADLAFAQLCRQLVAGEPPPLKIIAAPLPTFEMLALPYDLYDERDLAHRVIYVEASRGCPFTCEFCLSSLEVPVRAVALEPFLAEMERLLERGVRQFKFVDRTFNLNLRTSTAILQFFLARWQPDLFVHFEMVPDRLPEALRSLIAQFPPGALQFEVGIQTFNPEVETLISRRQNQDRLSDNLRWLRRHSGVHIHADLIAGLPGEDMASFARGFDRLVELAPQEIQVGILKRLRGTPIIRHDREWGMVYGAHPPYEVLQTRLVDFATMQRLRRFAKFWDIYGNSGHFTEALPLLWRGGSPFAGVLAFSDWLHERGVKGHGIARSRQYELLHEFLLASRPAGEVEPPLARDYHRSGGSDRPRWLAAEAPVPTRRAVRPGHAKRQQQHQNKAA
ncbi:MAG TPA: DUF4080 domain-containing protein [Chthoniobacteraceae bacterium]|jgi:radical SAM superfamily enzyme YgiQ (UPF0313 family)|nr:DUF4080 domain-containing protein [Chthoniobacteraceae bacterium]